MTEKYFVYILKSLINGSKSYVGFTRDINRRLTEHNDKNNKAYTKRYAPWKLQTYMIFSDLKKALKFEKYLKSGSGKSFINNHL